jgi:hypothetical protein
MLCDFEMREGERRAPTTSYRLVHRDPADEDLHRFGNRSVISSCLRGYKKGHFERNPGVMSPALNSLLRDMAIENELTPRPATCWRCRTRRLIGRLPLAGNRRFGSNPPGQRCAAIGETRS